MTRSPRALAQQKMQQRKQQEALLLDMLTVMDSLDRAVEHWQQAQDKAMAIEQPEPSDGNSAIAAAELPQVIVDSPVESQNESLDQPAAESTVSEEPSSSTSTHRFWWQQLASWWVDRAIAYATQQPAASIATEAQALAESSVEDESTLDGMGGETVSETQDIAKNTIDVANIVTSALDGTALIHSTMADILAKHQVVPIPALGQPFDPTEMRALGQEPDGTVSPNTVVKEVVRGYRWNDKVLRESQVIVAIALAQQT
ncbi:MAG: nucleotide exchange factor GrpE [Leptolyngbyaceae cyanobacterium]